jgi:hypothetical protein
VEQVLGGGLVSRGSGEMAGKGVRRDNMVQRLCTH